LIGGRARFVFSSPFAPSCLAADAVATEVAEHLPSLAEKRGLDPALLFAALSVVPVSWQARETYESARSDAVKRMAGRDPADWPTVALAIARNLPIWSQDKDMQASGLTIYTTGDLLDALRSAEQ
jgi:predicted nucleic acid-binding protein